MSFGLLGRRHNTRIGNVHAITHVVSLDFCELAPGAWLYFFVAGRLDAGLAFPRAWRTLAS